MNKVLAVDIGSSRTHIGVVDMDGLRCVSRVNFDNSEFDVRFHSSIIKFVSAHPRIGAAHITSCVKSLAAKAAALCKKEVLPDNVRVVKAHDALPVQNNYDNPQALGTDRLCNALACASLFAGRSCVIIDAGTALTIDYLHGGTLFGGGAILPGCATQAEALHRRTDALPLVKLGDIDDGLVALPATSTEGCIRAGILFGMAGAVERCTDEYLRLDANAKVVATGGGWDIIEPLTGGHDIETIPDLTLIGAAAYK